MHKLARMPAEKAAKKIAKEHLQNTDPEAVRQLTKVIEMMRAIGGTDEEWEQAFKDAEKLTQ